MRMDIKFSQSDETFMGKFGEMVFLNGATYRPHISDDGTLSWSNDQNLPNPEPFKLNGSGKHYYSTKREEVCATHEDINSAYIFGLYRELVEKYPDLVKEQELCVETDEGTFVNYEYVISTGERSTSGYYSKKFDADEHIRKPKYLVMSGIHGRERKAVFSAYRFVCDLLSGRNVPSAFKEGVILHVMPVACPWGFDNYTRWNANQVNIFQNFPTGEVWEKTWSDFDLDGENDYHNGDFAASEVETQAIMKWLEENADAELFIDVHNGSMTNEITCIFGVPENDQVDAAKKTALRGIDRIIPYWRDVIQYPDSMKEAKVKLVNGEYVIETVDKPVIFSYCVSSDETMKSGPFIYATNMVGIPSLCMELSSYYGDWDEWSKDEEEGKFLLAYHPESIAAGAEALGNILIEFYEQSFMGEVNEDMKQIDNKLDNILEGVSFRIERGVMEITADRLPEEGKSAISIDIPCGSNVKLIDWHADDGTKAVITKTKGTNWAYSLLVNKGFPAFSNVGGVVHPYVSMTYQSALSSINEGWVLYHGSTKVENIENGIRFAASGLKTGKYEWTAYYWNE